MSKLGPDWGSCFVCGRKDGELTVVRGQRGNGTGTYDWAAGGDGRLHTVHRWHLPGENWDLLGDWTSTFKAPE